MASFSIFSKTYAKDKLSKCATTVLLVCCKIYHKRSNTINVNAEAKEQGRDMQTPIDDSLECENHFRGWYSGEIIYNLDFGTY